MKSLADEYCDAVDRMMAAASKAKDDFREGRQDSFARNWRLANMELRAATRIVDQSERGAP